MWHVSRSSYLTFLPAVILIAACSGSPDEISAEASIEIIQPAGEACQSTVAPATFTTLRSLSNLYGLMGRVVTSDANLDVNRETLDYGVGFDFIDTQFSESSGVYYPADYQSLFGASLYYAIEKGYLLLKGLNPKADVLQIDPNFANVTSIVYNAQRTYEGQGRGTKITDNAEFLPNYTQQRDGQVVLKNYLFAYPSQDIELVPLGLNLGIMVHEFTHLVFNYLFYEEGTKRGLSLGIQKPTDVTLASLDEGNADYFGYLASKDPKFFLCSYPDSNRNLAVPKAFTSDWLSRLTSPDAFDSHEGGAIWASINFEIGQAVGHDVNGRILIDLMTYLLECPETTLGGGRGTVDFDFRDAAACHVRLMPDGQKETVKQIYNKYLGVLGGL